MADDPVVTPLNTGHDWATNAQYYHGQNDLTKAGGWGCAVSYCCFTYYDSVTSTGNQLVLARAIPIPVNTIIDLDIVATMANPTWDKGGRTKAEGTIMRGTGSVIRPAAINLTHVKNLGSTTVDVFANVQTQTADVLVGGTAAGAGTVQWHVWTTIRTSS